MKKVLVLIVAAIVSPLVVFAVVDENTQTTQWEVATTPDAATQCSDAENLNDTNALQHGTSGYYIYCIRISCTNNVNVHSIEHPLSGALTCSNGNTNPHVIVSSSGAQGDELREGAACTGSGAYAYATEKMFYNCSLDTGTTTKVSTTKTTKVTTTTKASTTTRDPKEETTTTTTTEETTEPTTTLAPVDPTTQTPIDPTTQTPEETTTVKSPDTGVEDYFLALGGTVAVLVAGLYIIDKKNIFKKI